MIVDGSVEFDCGHTAEFPKDWESRAKTARYPAHRKYWLDQSMTGPVGTRGVAACPKCPGSKGSVQDFTVVKSADKLF